MIARLLILLLLLSHILALPVDPEDDSSIECVDRDLEHIVDVAPDSDRESEPEISAHFLSFQGCVGSIQAASSDISSENECTICRETLSEPLTVLFNCTHTEYHK